MSLTGNVGRLCLVDQENLLLNQRVGKIMSDSKNTFFFYLFFNRPENKLRLEQISGGSSQANLSPIDAVNCLFVQPYTELLKSFNQRIEPIFNKIINCKLENHKLSELRDWLLPMLMNGQVKVMGKPHD
jgi:type I restriction enzyme S subunit